MRFCMIGFICALARTVPLHLFGSDKNFMLMVLHSVLDSVRFLGTRALMLLCHFT